MNITKLQTRAATWNKAFKPKRKRTPEYTIAHATEEWGEMVKDWRAGKITETFSTDENGLDHPEGLGSELADVMIFCGIIADQHGIDLAASVATKMNYLESKLIAKEDRRA